MTMIGAEQFRAFRFALDPTTAQRQDLGRHVGAARWAYNHALARKVAAHQQWRSQVAALIDAGVPEDDVRRQIKVRIPTKPTIQLALNRAKGDDRTGHDGLCPWWHEVSTYAFQSAFVDADTAWANWLASLSGRRTGRKIGYPRFKKKGRSRDSVRLHHDARRPTIRLDGYRRLMVPRIGSIRLHDSGKRLTRYLTRTGGQIQSVTLSRSGKHWYAAVLVKSPAAEPSTASRAQRIAGTVGVDLGVTRLATLSTGIDTSYPNPRHLAVARRQLTRAQRALSRTQKAPTGGRRPAAGSPSCTIASRNEEAGHCTRSPSTSRRDLKRLLSRTSTSLVWPGPPAAPWINLAGTSGRSPASTARSWTPGSVNSAANWPTRQPGTDPDSRSSTASIPAPRPARPAAQ
jgi:transposase